MEFIFLSRFCINARRKEGGQIKILRSARRKLIAVKKDSFILINRKGVYFIYLINWY